MWMHMQVILAMAGHHFLPSTKPLEKLMNINIETIHYLTGLTSKVESELAQIQAQGNLDCICCKTKWIISTQLGLPELDT